MKWVDCSPRAARETNTILVLGLGVLLGWLVFLCVLTHRSRVLGRTVVALLLMGGVGALHHRLMVSLTEQHAISPLS